MFAFPRSGALLYFAVCSLVIFNHFVRGQTNYCEINSCAKGQHTLCLYQSTAPSGQCTGYNSSGLLTSDERDVIVKTHNDWRKKVAEGLETQGNPGPQPPASDMKIMVWIDELARIAQRYADQCSNGHDACRNIEQFPVGQNIATLWSTAQPDTSVGNLMQGWYDEVRLFSKDNVARYSFDASYGHYSQVAWANSSGIGCGRVLFFDTSLRMNCVRLICNYGPTGNYIGQSVYRIGQAGSACPSGVSGSTPSLCN